MNHTFSCAYTGFYGQMDSTAAPGSTVFWKLGEPGAPFSGKNGAIQWLHPHSDEKNETLLGTPEGQILLAGLVWSREDTPVHIANVLITSILSGNYHDLATISENAAGCLISNDGAIYLWVGFASNDSVFFRPIDRQICWSTNPLDLVVAEDDIDLWDLRRCCHGDDAFIYSEEKIQRVEQGHLVRLQRSNETGILTVHDVVFDRFCPDAQLASQTMTLAKAVQRTREVLLDAVRPLAYNEPIGMMLSGGVGSAALLYAMKQVGVNVIAYHIDAGVREASESQFARLACEALNVPLVCLPMDNGADYLSPEWVFCHPDGHPWVRWFEQIAQRARQDRITLLVTGAGDDHAFGPEMEYGVHSILSAKIPWSEKGRMLRGLLSTDWNITDIVRSVWSSCQLIGLTYLAGPSKEDGQMRRADFLSPLPSYQREIDAALLHSPVFTPQAMSVEQTVLQPNGIRLYYPYYHRRVQALSLALPNAYRLMPAASLPPHIARLVPELERVVDKPVLRLACEDIPLPREVVWRTWGICTPAAIQEFCLKQVGVLQHLLSSDSCLARMKILDPCRLEQVLSSRAAIRNNYTSLVASALVEIFLRKAFHDQYKRGGPLWN